MANARAARQVAGPSPRLYPVGKAIVLFAVCAPELAGRRLSVGGRRVQAIRYGRLALLVAYVDRNEYAAVEVERRRADAAWFSAEARVLETAVERVATHGRVLPQKILTVLPHAEALERYAREHNDRWTRALGRLGSKRECAVHLYAGPHAPPGGAPYVARVASRAARSGKAPAFPSESAIARHALAVWNEVTSLAIATRSVGPGERRGALWSAVLLLDEGDVPALAAMLERSIVAGKELGVTAYLEGPRAPFTFV